MIFIILSYEVRFFSVLVWFWLAAFSYLEVILHFQSVLAEEVHASCGYLIAPIWAVFLTATFSCEFLYSLEGGVCYIWKLLHHLGMVVTLYTISQVALRILHIKFFRFLRTFLYMWTLYFARIIVALYIGLYKHSVLIQVE